MTTSLARAFRITILFGYFLCGSIQHRESQSQETTAKVAQDQNDPAKEKNESDDLIGQRKEAQKSVDDITAAIAKTTDPRVYRLYEDRGDAFMVLGKYDEAFDDYTRAMEAKVKAKRGGLYFLFDKRVEAALEKRDYRQALSDAMELTKASISPPQARPFALVALILARSPDEKVRDSKASLDYAIRAKNTDKDMNSVIVVERALASAYSANGDFKAAVDHQEKSIAAIMIKIPSIYKEELDAYKAGKEYPFKKKGQD